MLEDSAYVFQAQGQDANPNASLTYAIVNRPLWAQFDAASGKLHGTPQNGDVGNHTNIQISVSDGEYSAALPAFNITVVNTNDAPTISGSPTTSVLEDSDYWFKAIGQDVDVGDSLTYTITNVPAWATFDNVKGELTGKPGNAHVGGYHNIVIGVTDGTAAVQLAPFSITVVNTNDAPTITGSPASDGQ